MDARPIRTFLLIGTALTALSGGVAWVVAVNWPEAARELMILSPMALDDAEPSFRPKLGPQPAAGPHALPRTPHTASLGVEWAAGRDDGVAPADLLRRAQAGDAKAQLHLARLYESGAPGLRRDLAAARFWTRRAAGGGEPIAMHNLGLFLMQGEGGPRDIVEAAAWFQRAAERGVVDAQFNLALLYEAGEGVDRSARSAYRWFAIAARAGDPAAGKKQIELGTRLAAAERAGLDRDVATFRPSAAGAPELAVVIPPATTLAETQTLLARKGYYIGPMDGVESPALLSAAVAYLRDHPASAVAAN